MRNAHPKYMCFPSVVPIGKEVEITIVPRDNSRIFREGKEYELGIKGLLEENGHYGTRIEKEHPCYIKEGCLCFKHTFTSEQEYTVRFAEKDTKPEIRISLYAVEDDLYERRPLKGDFHAHSYYSDGGDGIAVTPADYREEGFDFFALTDHNRMFPSTLAKELYDGIPLGMHIMKGEEVHTPGTGLHIVHVGGSDSVANRYIHHDDEFKSEVAEIEETLTHIPEKYRHRIALARWACREIHKVGGLAIFAHPFWYPNLYNISKEFCDLLFDEKIFDAFEIVGCMQPYLINVQQQLWVEQKDKGNYLAPLGSSDSHNHDFAVDGFGRRFSIVFAKENTTEAILEAVKNGYSIAAEVPNKVDNEVRFYGANTRLMLFAHFLYQHYFSETWRLCFGEGVLMRRYAEGEEVGEILSGLADTTLNFYKRFYGILPPVTITERNKAFLDKALDMQINIGPVSKGSDIFIYGSNVRRE